MYHPVGKELGVLRVAFIRAVVQLLSRVRLFATSWTVAHQALLSMEFSRQEYWSGLPFPSPADLPDPAIKTQSPALQMDSLPSEPPGKPHVYVHISMYLLSFYTHGHELGQTSGDGEG